MKRVFAGCSTVMLLAACSDSGSAVTNYADIMAVENLTAENLVVESSQPAPPTHRYEFQDGDLYGYVGVVSEEDQKKAIASPPVVRFRYSGFWDGAHHLQLIGDDGAVLAINECRIPCVAIKQTSYNGQIRRVGYSPDSIIGAAFADAINGQLRRSPAVGTVEDGYRFKGGNPGLAANWEPVIGSSPSVASTSAQKEPDAVENLTAENSVVENLVAENLLAENE